MKVGFVGLGKLGLPCALGVESMGHTVFGVDPSPQTMDILECRKLAYEEVGAQTLLDETKIHLVTYAELVRDAELIFIAVQTPHDPQYEGVTPIPNTRSDFNYEYLQAAFTSLCVEMVRQGVDRDVVVISTVLPGTMAKYIQPIIDANGLSRKLRLLYNPFFIAMGTALRDFLNPEFVLIGGPCPATTQRLARFYQTIHDRPAFRTTVENAELIKVAYNTYIGMKIVFANTMMEICHKTPNTDCDAVTGALSLATDRLLSPRYLTGGMGDGGGCLPAGELVMTEHGPRPIDTIKVGDLVLSSDGLLKPVRKVWKRNYRGEMLTLRTEGMPPARFTIDHGMYAAEDGRKFCVVNGKPKRVTVRKAAELLQELVEVKAGELSLGDFIPQVRPVGDQVALPAHVTPDYCDIAGWYLAEGSMELSARRGRVGFELHADEEVVGWRLLQLCHKVAPQPYHGRGAGNGGSVTVKDNKCQARYGSKQLAQMLYDDFGSHAEAKQVPNWVVYGPDWVAKRVMPGLWQGDGTGSEGVTLATTSPNIAYAGLLLMARFGITAVLRKIPPRTGVDGTRHREAYEVQVRNAKDWPKARELTGIEPPMTTQAKFYDRYPERDGVCYRKLTRITREFFKGPVWNLWIDGEDHTFTTNVGFVSNCHPRDNIAMSWLAQRLDLSHDFFYDIMSAREDQTEWLADLIQEHDKGLPVALMGSAFKPNTNITTGSPARLLSHYLTDRKIEHKFIEPNQRMFVQPPSLFFVSTQHSTWLQYNFPEGSVVLDPFRYLQGNESLAKCTYVPIGKHHAVRRPDSVAG